MSQYRSRNGRDAGGGTSKVKYVLIAVVMLLSVALIAVGCMITGHVPVSVQGAGAQEVPAQEARFTQGVSVDGVALGGLNLDGAKKLLNASQKTPSLGNITVTSGERSAVLDASGAIVTRNTDDILDVAIRLGNVGTRNEMKEERSRIESEGERLETTVTYDVSGLSEEVMRVAKELSVDPVNASATYNPDNPEIFDFVEGTDGARVNAITLEEMLQKYVDEGDFSKPLEVPFETIPPEITSEMVRQNNTLVSTTTSSFSKGTYSKANRVFNIAKAAEIISGYVLAPGESFSFNDVVGPRTASGGWKAAGAINDGQSVDEIGGGICQVSSTLFNSVLKADLEIVKRSPHSWPLSYLPAGQDATVSTGGPDFIFKNNRDTPVIIVAKVDTEDKKEITIDIYGAPLPDGIRIELESNKIASIAKPATQVKLDPNMKPGSSEVTRKGRAGSKYETYKLYYKGDELINKELAYNSTYRAIAEQVVKGPEKVVADPGVPDESVPDESGLEEFDDIYIPDEEPIILE